MLVAPHMCYRSGKKRAAGLVSPELLGAQMKKEHLLTCRRLGVLNGTGSTAPEPEGWTPHGGELGQTSRRRARTANPLLAGSRRPSSGPATPTPAIASHRNGLSSRQGR